MLFGEIGVFTLRFEVVYSAMQGEFRCPGAPYVCSLCLVPKLSLTYHTARIGIFSNEY